MGYDTKFKGTVTLDKPLTLAHFKYLEAFLSLRHMARNKGIEKLPDPLRKAVGLPIGKQGEFYVDDDSTMHESVKDVNNPAKGVPGLNCDWQITEDGQGIEWSGMEKFYGYTEWMKYLIDRFLAPWGYVANGRIEWQGDEVGDFGILVVENNQVQTFKANEIPVGKEANLEDKPHHYSREEVIAALKGFIDDSKEALKKMNAMKDPSEELGRLHADINALYHSVDEGEADL